MANLPLLLPLLLLLPSSALGSTPKRTPPKPVNCVYSSWSEWSQCSQTCIPRKTHSYWPKDVDPFDPDPMYITEKDARHKELPTRKRRMHMIKEASHGGKCPQHGPFSRGAVKGPEDKPFIEQVEECVLAEAHTLDEKMNKEYGDHFKWPAVPYPGDDPRTVGYCPVDCEWNQAVVTNDCKLKQEKYFNSTEENSDCYSLQILEINPRLKHEEKLAIFAEAEKRMKEHTLLWNTFDGNKGKLESLAAIRKKMWRRRQRETYLFKYLFPFKQDLENIYDMTTQISMRVAKLPNLNGLYGGKPCNTTDGKELTKYAAEEYNPKKWYGTYEDIVKEGHCDLKLCSLDRHEPKPGQPETNGSEPECQKDGGCMSMWTAWSPWGKCNKDFGNRTRTRTCVCACDHSVEKKDCTPIPHPHKKITNEDIEPCKRNQ